MNQWHQLSETEKQKSFAFCEEYKKFLSENKTERECVTTLEQMALSHDFLPIATCAVLRPGDKVYAINMHKDFVMAVIGTEPFEKGFRLVASHLDSPRMDIKVKPLSERSDICYFDSHYYGGIKPYHYMARPLAMHGVVCQKNGKTIRYCIGERDEDPCFCISDIAPHFTKKRREKHPESEINYTDEQLDIIVGNEPLSKEQGTTANVLQLLQRLGIEKEDFFSAELSFVPKGQACDLGFDRSLVAGYGQDDRSSVFCTAQAFFEVKNPKKTAIFMGVDKEETNSRGATGTDSLFLKSFLTNIMQHVQGYQEIGFQEGLLHSEMLSVDVTAAYDPNWSELENDATEAHLACGVSLSKYGSGGKGKKDTNDANAEYIAMLRNLLDNSNICYQFTEMGRLDVVEGGTISAVLAEMGGNVIDVGVPILSMHAPCEIASKFDLWQSFLFYRAFLE